MKKKNVKPDSKWEKFANSPVTSLSWGKGLMSKEVADLWNMLHISGVLHPSRTSTWFFLNHFLPTYWKHKHEVEQQERETLRRTQHDT